MPFNGENTYKTDEYFRLSFFESSELYLFLVKYFSEVDTKLTHLVHYKFELLHLLLYAHFGIKSTLFGIKKTTPYKMSNQEEVEEKFRKVNSEIKALAGQSIIFHDIYVSLAKYFIYPYDEGNKYKELINEKESVKLKYLKEGFDKLGIEKSIEEYTKLIKYYSNKIQYPPY